jgi:MFS family permease
MRHGRVALLQQRIGPPGVRAFAFISAFDAVVRGTMLSVYPLLMYRAWGDAAVVSLWYFGIGLASLLTALSIPWLVRKVPRRRVYAMGVGFYLLAAVFGVAGGRATTLALLCHAVAAAHIFVCFNAYVLDSIPKTDFGRLESLRLLYGGIGWTVGPVLGVWLLRLWHGAPFVLVALAALTMLAAFWWTGVSGNRVSATGLQRSPHPLAYLGRFLAQRRLVAGWLFALLRSCGWWVFVVYVGIYAVQKGLGDQVGGTVTSLVSVGAFFAPLMLRWMQRHSVRHAVRTGFRMSGLLFLAAALTSPWPWLAVALMLLGACYLVLLDICGGLPFMMSVKPSQRTEMSAVYSTFRDVSGILGPAVAWVVLQFAPVAGVFAAAGLALLGAWLMAGQLHPQLGMPGAQRARLRRAGRAGPA